MRISKELIEKYHDGNCSPEEKRAVENWLFNDDPEAEMELRLPSEERRNAIRDSMWKDIESVLPEKQKTFSYTFFKPFLRQAAAILLISGVIAALYSVTHSVTESRTIVFNNTSKTINKNLNEQEYTISLGPNSNIQINDAGKIDFCGAMMINPKKDIEVTIQGICVKPGEKSERMKLKKGQNYIALNYGNTLKTNEIIILSQGSMTGLPPLVQRQLMMQFNI